MPSRLMSLLILIYWSIAAFCLLTWDVLPELTMGYPPDLRGIAFASDSSRPVRWSIQVLEDPRHRRSPDGRRSGDVLDAPGRRLVRDDEPRRVRRGRPAPRHGAGDAAKACACTSRAGIMSTSGNLQNFDLRVASKDFGDELVHVTGRLHEGKMEIVSRGPMPILNNDIDLQVRAAERGQRRAGAARPAAGAARRPAVGDRRSSTRSPARWSQVRAEVTAADGDPLGRETRSRPTRWSRRCPSCPDADLGPHRRGDPAAGGAVPVRAAGAGAARRGTRRRLRVASIVPGPTGGRHHDRGPRRDQAVRDQVRGRPPRPGGPRRASCSRSSGPTARARRRRSR